MTQIAVPAQWDIHNEGTEGRAETPAGHNQDTAASSAMKAAALQDPKSEPAVHNSNMSEIFLNPRRSQ
jgi:hypothetical protein